MREPVLKDRSRVSLKEANSDGFNFKNVRPATERQRPGPDSTTEPGPVLTSALSKVKLTSNGRLYC